MTDQPDVASDIAEALAADAPSAANLQTRVRRGGAAARAAVLAIASSAEDDAPHRLRYRAAVLAADACADDAFLRRILADSAHDPAASTLADLLAEAAIVGRVEGPAQGILTDAAVTADLLFAAVEARPNDARIAEAVLESLGDTSGFTAASRPVRSRENAGKVLRNGMALLTRSEDDAVRRRLEHVLLARMTPAASAANDDLLRAVLASPSGRGHALIEDLARGGAPGIQRQARRMLGDDLEQPAMPAAVAGETIAIQLDVATLWEAEGERVKRADERATGRETTQSAPAPSPPEPPKRSWWARLFGRR